MKIGTSPFDRYFALLILTPIIGVCLTEVLYLVGLGNYIAKNNLVLIDTLLMFLGELPAFIFELISKLLAKKEGTSIHSKRFLASAEEMASFSYPFLLILLITIIDLVRKVLTSLFKNVYSGNTTREDELQIVRLAFTAVFCYYVWKYPIYKHQIVSFVLLFIGGILVYVSDYQFNASDLLFLITLFLRTIRLLLEKWLLEKKYVSPYLYLSYQGAIGFCLTTVLLLLCSYVPAISAIHDESFSDLAKLFQEWRVIVYLFVDITLICIFNVMLVLINKYYNPNQIVVTVSLQNVLFLIVLLFIGVNRNLALYIIGDVFILFGAMMYNEIVIFYYRGLADNTRKEIAKRGSMNVEAVEILELNDLVKSEEDILIFD